MRLISLFLLPKALEIDFDYYHDYAYSYLISHEAIKRRSEDPGEDQIIQITFLP